MRFVKLGLFSCLFLITTAALRAEEKPALVFQNLGLKNNYRIVFEQWDEENHFASGALEISDNNEDKLHTRIPFSAEVKVDAKDKKTEVLAVRCTAMEFFFPPANKKDPYPPLTWKLTGRKTKEATLKASLWTLGRAPGCWTRWILKRRRSDLPASDPNPAVVVDSLREAQEAVGTTG